MGIVERLRLFAEFKNCDEKLDGPNIIHEAADEIELLRKERDGLREALKPFASVVKGNWNEQPDTMPMSYGFGVDKRFDLTLGDFRKARAALKEDS